MPIPLINYQPGTPEQTNPYANLISNALKNYGTAVQARYAQPMAEQSLQEAILKNALSKQQQEWNPKIWQSEIGLRGAEVGKLGKETQWYDKEAQSRINLQGAQAAGLNAEAGMNQLKLDYLKAMMNNNPKTSTSDQMQTDNMGYNTSQPATTQSLPNAQNNTIYGIETPSLTKQDIANKMLLGIDTYKPRLDNATKQQQDQYTQYQKTLADTIQEANSAQKAKQILSVFNNAMDNTSLRGAFWGGTPSEGWRTLYHSGENVKNAQIADNAISNLLPGAITELREAMKTGQFSVADLNAASRMKVSRTMDDATRQTQTQWLNGIYDRFDEKSKFYTAMGNPTTGAQKTTTDMLWEQYQRDFPLISADGKTYQGSSLGNWPLYTTPRAISSIQNKGTYTPTAAEKNAFMMKLPDGRVVPIKKGKVESAFRKGARPL